MRTNDVHNISNNSSDTYSDPTLIKETETLTTIPANIHGNYNSEDSGVTLESLNHLDQLATHDTQTTTPKIIEKLIRNRNVKYIHLFLLLLAYEGWILLNSMVIYLAELGECSGEFSLSVYHFNEVAHGIGYGMCGFPPEYTQFLIVTSIVTNLLGLMIFLETVGHVLEIEVNHGERKAMMAQITVIIVFIFFYFTFVALDMILYNRHFYDSTYYVFSTAFTSGDKGPHGWHLSSDMTKSTGTTGDRILNIICVQMMSLGYMYCSALVAHYIWSNLIKQKVLIHLDHKKDIIHFQHLVEHNALESQSIINVEILDKLVDTVDSAVKNRLT